MGKRDELQGLNILRAFIKDDNNSSFTLQEELSNISAIVAIIELNFDQSQ